MFEGLGSRARTGWPFFQFVDPGGDVLLLFAGLALTGPATKVQIQHNPPVLRRTDVDVKPRGWGYNTEPSLHCR